ncbi:hypothetical protein Q5P01_019963 [Channa striata]|uniref:Uncharacterized protein n=1 Tax=Channa striata TaxID=64152 RepID=A0AA88SEB1_CHASR|nr:hypothetical protein Q5P01_019963 [Channa striata]
MTQEVIRFDSSTKGSVRCKADYATCGLLVYIVENEPRCARATCAGRGEEPVESGGIEPLDTDTVHSSSAIPPGLETFP